jgi:hypothetical protein
MKRAGKLFDAIAAWENLRQATAKALRGKRSKTDARAFVANLDANLKRLRDQLLSNDVRLGRFHQFTIHDPKERLITAPCFEERVLHHAILNVCEPVFERWLIFDTYAVSRRNISQTSTWAGWTGLSRRNCESQATSATWTTWRCGHLRTLHYERPGKQTPRSLPTIWV